jgi:glutathione S-transferase
MNPFGDLISDPAIRAWGIANAVVALKTMAAGMYTSSIRLRRKVFISPEDYAMQGLAPAAGPDADVERARRIHQNDLEAGVPFALVGLVYALTHPSTAGLWICFAGFPVARILHSIAYARALMPHRTIAFTFGFAVTLWMAVSSLFSLLG